MNQEKADSQLRLALDATEAERKQAGDEVAGYDTRNRTWELIVKFNGNIEALEAEGILVAELLGGYAVLQNVQEDRIAGLLDLPEIEYIEVPKAIYFAVVEGASSSCVTPVSRPPLSLSGSGTLIAILDSGIDYTHPDFRNPDGTTRIAALWDQTIPGDPPAGYHRGTLYTEEQINAALQAENPLRIVPSQDLSGHGTHVAGIAAGNGRASDGVNRGIAPEAGLVVVKLGTPDAEGFPRTTQLMEAVDYAIRFALERRQPIAVNISFGNNFGSHSSNSLLERYLDGAAGVWKNVIVIGTGNEGNTGRHQGGIVSTDNLARTELGVGNYETRLAIQIWKNYYDQFQTIILAPGGLSYTLSSEPGIYRTRLGETTLRVLVGTPTPYSSLQEIYVELTGNPYVRNGLWTWLFVPRRIVRGNYDMWLPVGTGSSDTNFLQPTPETSLTIPSTASLPIAVGAYNSRSGQMAPFSGRGFTRDNQYVKPTLVAPGVNILSTAPGGGYTVKSGTSMATPFVSGAAALMMEWGILQGNDPFLYGQKLKAYLMNGAKRVAGFPQYPNPQTGYGALCVRDSLPL